MINQVTGRKHLSQEERYNNVIGPYDFPFIKVKERR
jgi:hypothetical protein